MKTTNKAVLTLLVLGASAWIATAQDGGNPPAGERPPRREGPGGSGGGDGKRPVPPLMAALDANHDGTIDEAEIASASTALKKLDKNGDGKISPEELRMQRPDGGPGGQGGQQGGRPQRPPGNN